MEDIKLITLKFKSGSLIVEDDGRTRTYAANHYGEILNELRTNGKDFSDEALKAPEIRLSSLIKLRDYQVEALSSWVKANNNGIVVLPTGAGKTYLAIKAMEIVSISTLIVVPTLVLVDQWKKTLESSLGIDVGVLGGGEDDVKSITVTTYDSAVLRAHKLGDKFGMIIFDEVHHLPAQTNRKAATSYLAPYRMGLTATLGRDPQAIETLRDLIGSVVYEKKIEDLAGTHLSDYTIKTIHVPLTPDERLEYEWQYTIYRNFLLKRGIKIRSAKDFLNLVKRSGTDPEARRAIMARNTAMDTALNSRSKLEYLRELLNSSSSEKSLIFTRHNKLVYKISRELLIPAITHQTGKDEREEILNRFKDGTYLRIVTSQVLDEGVDVPDASLAVILSGTGSSREFIQRLGRVLRKKENKKATLVELVSLDTAEVRLSKRRKEG